MIMNNLADGITEKSVSDLVSRFDDNIINEKIKQFLNIFIIKRRNKMIDIFNQYSNSGGM